MSCFCWGMVREEHDLLVLEHAGPVRLGEGLHLCAVHHDGLAVALWDGQAVELQLCGGGLGDTVKKLVDGVRGDEVVS